MERFDKLTRSAAASPAPVAIPATVSATRAQALAQLDATSVHFSRDVMRIALQRPTWLTPDSAIR